VFRRGALFLPVCDSLARRIVALGAPPERVVVHRTGIDLTRWTWRARTKAEGEPLRLVTVGRLVEKKGIGYVLDAMRRLADAGVAVEFEIVGDGPLYRQLEAQRDRLGLGGRVRLLGWQDQPQVGQALIGRTSWWPQHHGPATRTRKGFNVLKEAMASGLPVVATRHGGILGAGRGRRSRSWSPSAAPGAGGPAGTFAAHPDAGPRWRLRPVPVERDYDIERLNDRLVTLFAGLNREQRER
jgi:colanic acid/amylovoran biosynthesis glycosyltransferase